MAKLINILVDNDSWILPYAEKLKGKLEKQGYSVELARSAEDIKQGWVCFMLGCTRIVNDQNLDKNLHNLVVHESDLPAGKGFAPMTWQILEGKSSIPICLLEAASEMDSGNIWIKDVIELDGNELNDEWRDKQGKKTIELCESFIEDFDNLTAQEQVGVSSVYARRKAADSQLDINKSIAEQFDLLRVVDNERYPAFFVYKNTKYKVQITKED